MHFNIFAERAVCSICAVHWTETCLCHIQVTGLNKEKDYSYTLKWCLYSITISVNECMKISGTAYVSIKKWQHVVKQIWIRKNCVRSLKETEWAGQHENCASVRMRIIMRWAITKTSRSSGHKNTHFLQFLFVKMKFSDHPMPAVFSGIRCIVLMFKPCGWILIQSWKENCHIWNADTPTIIIKTN